MQKMRYKSPSKQMEHTLDKRRKNLYICASHGSNATTREKKKRNERVTNERQRCNESTLLKRQLQLFQLKLWHRIQSQFGLEVFTSIFAIGELRSNNSTLRSVVVIVDTYLTVSSISCITFLLFFLFCTSFVCLLWPRYGTGKGCMAIDN